MAYSFNYRGISQGVMAGVISGLVGLGFAYVIGIVAISLRLRDLFATFLAAVTVLPLMLIIVCLLPSVMIGAMIGFLLGAASNFRSYPFGLLAGVIIGLVCGEIILSVVTPLIVTPHPGDFIAIITNPYLSAGYGVLLGVLTSLIFRWLDRRKAGT